VAFNQQGPNSHVQRPEAKFRHVLEVIEHFRRQAIIVGKPKAAAGLRFFRASGLHLKILTPARQHRLKYDVTHFHPNVPGRGLFPGDGPASPGFRGLFGEIHDGVGVTGNTHHHHAAFGDSIFCFIENFIDHERHLFDNICLALGRGQFFHVHPRMAINVYATRRAKSEKKYLCITAC